MLLLQLQQRLLIFIRASRLFIVQGLGVRADFIFSREWASQTLANTGLAFVAGHQYTFSIFSPAGATSVTWEIENVTTGDVATGVATGTLPALMTRMRPAASVGTINAVARSMWFQSLYAEADF